MGVVSEVDGIFMIGVSVMVKGIIIGIVIDLDGFYFLNLVVDVEIFIFSYIGFIFKEVDLGVSSVINVVFDEGVILEIVVVMVFGIECDCKVFIYVVEEVGGDVLV